VDPEIRSIFMRTLRTSITLCITVFVVMLAGCGTASKEIQIKSQSKKTDVFSETKIAKPVPEGFADLIVKASIKTPLEGYYVLESKKSLHGKPGYPFLVNIDGQAALQKIGGIRDNKPAYDQDGKTSRDPEAREGMKYFMEKRVRLRVGQHRIFFGLPEENYSTTVDIVVKNGEEALLEYKPMYRHKRLPARIPSFLEGIDRYAVFLNGSQL
jgi:hypothetical protein